MTTETRESYLDRTFDDIVKEFEDLDLEEACRELRVLRLEYEAISSNKSDMEGKYKRVQELIKGRMDDRKVTSIGVDGVQYVAAQTEFGQVQDRDEFIAWAEVHDSGLIETKERKGEVNRIVREHLDNSEELPPGLGFYVKEYVSQTAS